LFSIKFELGLFLEVVCEQDEKVDSNLVIPIQNILLYRIVDNLLLLQMKTQKLLATQRRYKVAEVCVTIQRVWRGYHVRKQLREVRRVQAEGAPLFQAGGVFEGKLNACKRRGVRCFRPGACLRVS
jgi:hypothetical protein